MKTHRELSRGFQRAVVFHFETAYLRPLVNRPPRFNLSRTLGVLVLLAAWFALANHCALAVMSHGAEADEMAAVHKCCPRHAAAGEEQTPEQPMGACCKSLRVLPVEAGAKLVKAPDSPPMVAWVWVALVEMLAAERPVANARNATGPPGAWSFAEVVLQRSLLSHAPPFVA